MIGGVGAQCNCFLTITWAVLVIVCTAVAGDFFPDAQRIYISMGMAICSVLLMMEVFYSIFPWYEVFAAFGFSWTSATTILSCLAATDTETYYDASDYDEYRRRMAQYMLALQRNNSPPQNDPNNVDIESNSSVQAEASYSAPRQQFVSSSSTAENYLRTSAIDALMNLTKRQLKAIWRAKGNGNVEMNNKRDLAGHIVDHLGAMYVLNNVNQWEITYAANTNTSQPSASTSSTYTAPVSHNKANTTSGTLYYNPNEGNSSQNAARSGASNASSEDRAAAKDMLMNLEYSHLMAVSKGLGISVDYSQSKATLADKLINALGSETVLSHFTDTASVRPATSPAPAAPPPPPPNPPSNTLNSSSNASRPTGGLECAICLEAMGPNGKPVACSIVCGHTFCYDCFTETVRQYRKCPTCRCPMTIQQVKRMYY